MYGHGLQSRLVLIDLPPLGARVFPGSPEAGMLCRANVFAASAAFAGHPSLGFWPNPVVTGKGWKLAFKHVLHCAEESVNRFDVDGLRRVDPSDAGKPFIEFVGEVIVSRGRNKHQPMRVNVTFILWVLDDPKESGWGNIFSESPRWTLNPFSKFGANL